MKLRLLGQDHRHHLQQGFELALLIGFDQRCVVPVT
jgi:hypothetical protein